MGALEAQCLAIVILPMAGPCTVAAVIHERSIADTLEMVDTVFLAVPVHTVPIRQGSAFKNNKITCMPLASISFY